MKHFTDADLGREVRICEDAADRAAQYAGMFGRIEYTDPALVRVRLDNDLLVWFLHEQCERGAWVRTWVPDAHVMKT